MRLRLFQAAGMAEAMAAVRAELGPDAVILDSRRVKGGVKVTAALDAAPVAVAPAAPPAPSLARHNLPAGLAARLAGGSLAEGLAGALRFAPLPDGRARPLMLVGPPGAGKTLSCAKLATRAVLGGAAPLVASTDGLRAGATEQLAAFTRLLGLSLAVATEPEMLVRALAGRPPAQPVLVDSAGCDPFDAVQAAWLRGMALAIGAELVVVLPAGPDPAEAAETAAAFLALGARHLLPTRLDAARRLGGVLAAAAAGLALGEAGTGPGVTDGLTPIDPAWLAQRLAGPFRLDSAA
jgi:flagellar biosynthesis protein FlhF